MSDEECLCYELLTKEALCVSDEGCLCYELLTKEALCVSELTYKFGSFDVQFDYKICTPLLIDSLEGGRI